MSSASRSYRWSGYLSISCRARRRSRGSTSTFARSCSLELSITTSLSQSSVCSTPGRSATHRTFAIPEICCACSFESLRPSHVQSSSVGSRTKSISRWAGSAASGASTSTLSSCSMPVNQKRSAAGWSLSVPSPLVGGTSAACTIATQCFGSSSSSCRRWAMNRAGSIGACLMGSPRAWFV